MRARPRVLLGADSLRAEGSGIGRVARLMARVLREDVIAGKLDAQALCLRAGAADELGLRERRAGGSQLRFALAAHALALRYTHFAYDFAGIARAHARVPVLGRPFLTWLHGIEVWEDARADRVAQARRADILLANSAYTVERACGLHAGLDHARVCWLGTEDDEAAEPSQRHGAPTVVVLARLDEGGGYKGHRELIDCWPHVVAAVPDARLVIAGDGPGRAVLRGWVDASPAADAIEIAGFIPEAQIEALWARTWVLAMPSRGEGFGLVYIEAMRHAIPVVASVHDAGGEVNVDGETGYNVSLDRQDELPERLVELLRNDTRARAMGAAGQQRWREHFCYRAFRERFVPHLGALLAL